MSARSSRKLVAATSRPRRRGRRPGPRHRRRAADPRERAAAAGRTSTSADELAGIVDAPVHLINDADAEAIADYSRHSDQFGANQMFVSLSTGVGAAVHRRRRPSSRGSPTERARSATCPCCSVRTRRLCACGNRGCLEEVVSVTSLLGLPHGTDLESVDLAALAATAESRERIAFGARVLARALLLVGAALDVPNVVLGGAAPRLGAGVHRSRARGGRPPPGARGDAAQLPLRARSRTTSRSAAPRSTRCRLGARGRLGAADDGAPPQDRGEAPPAVESAAPCPRSWPKVATSA